MPKLYDDLAAWWPLLSPAAEYAEEAASYAATLVAACARPPRSVLELGSGGGSNAGFDAERIPCVNTGLDYVPEVFVGKRR